MVGGEEGFNEHLYVRKVCQCACFDRADVTKKILCVLDEKNLLRTGIRSPSFFPIILGKFNGAGASDAKKNGLKSSDSKTI